MVPDHPPTKDRANRSPGMALDWTNKTRKLATRTGNRTVKVGSFTALQTEVSAPETKIRVWKNESNSADEMPQNRQCISRKKIPIEYPFNERNDRHNSNRGIADRWCSGNNLVEFILLGCSLFHNEREGGVGSGVFFNVKIILQMILKSRLSGFECFAGLISGKGCCWAVWGCGGAVFSGPRCCMQAAYGEGRGCLACFGRWGGRICHT